MKCDLRLMAGDCPRKAVLGLALLGVAVGQVPMSSFLGDEVRWVNARTLAYGGSCGLESGPAASFANPALLALARSSAVEAGAGLVLASEQRTRIAYDQFENSMGEVAIAENIHSHAVAGPLAGVYRWGMLGLGAGVAPVRDFSYIYQKDYRDDFYVKIGEDRVEQSGAVYLAGLGVAARPVPWLAVGARAGYLFGSRNLEQRQIRGTDTTHVSDEGRMASIGFGAGLAVEPVRRLAVAADFCSGSRHDDWSGLSYTEPPQYLGKYPWQVRAGVLYRVPGSLPSVLSAEAEYEAWDAVDTTFANRLVVRAGVEHTMLNFVSLRYGFGVEPEPFDPTVQRVNAGAGLGFDAGFARIDLGMLFTHCVLDASGFSTPLAESDLKVYEDRSYFAFTVSRSF